MSESNNEEKEEDFDDEFSLDRLSEAYAEVMRQQAEESGSAARGELVADKVAFDEAIAEDPEEELDDEPAESSDDDAACPITPDSIVESILFVGVPKGETLTSKRIASVLRDVSPKEVVEIAKKLNEEYESENAAFRIEANPDSMRMVIAPDLKEFQNQFHGRNREVSLSQSAIDILAVVAYRQPISRDDIEKARNKSAGGVLNQLVRRDLLATVPDPKQARRKLYKTTERFLKLFHLDDLDDLPQSHEVTELDDFEAF